MGFWSDKHAIVTGGTGFLGSSIARTLTQCNAAFVTALPHAQCDLLLDDDIAMLFDLVLRTTHASKVVVIMPPRGLAALAQTVESQPSSSKTIL